ncbi:MAG: tetratricopeptide repeat protein [Gammaproteobacteria bacterium]|nr:tetratricopeptide repeat protein [Gammaproteobacteria bacterium]
MKDPELKAGEMALRAGNLELAIENFLAGLPTASSRRSESAALNNLCAAYGSLGQFEAALHYCERALLLRPNNWRAHQNRARSLIGIGELDAAIESANRGLEIAPNAAPLHEILALAQSFKRKPRVIIDTFDVNTQD